MKILKIKHATLPSFSLCKHLPVNDVERFNHEAFKKLANLCLYLFLKEKSQSKHDFV